MKNVREKFERRRKSKQWKKTTTTKYWTHQIEVTSASFLNQKNQLIRFATLAMRIYVHCTSYSWNVIVDFRIFYPFPSSSMLLYEFSSKWCEQLKQRKTNI